MKEQVMVVLTGKFDGKNFVADNLPQNLPLNTPVRIVVNPATEPNGLDSIINMAADADLPPDFAAQHEHYTKGTPRR
jgi:hypothetical protein